jgi:hypothetical protein
MPNTDTDTENTDTETDYTTDDDDYGDPYVYAPEEPSRTRFNIVLCEIYNNALYGVPESPTVDASYLALYRFKRMNYYVCDMANDFQERYADLFRENSPVINNHPIIRNYKNIVTRMGYIKPEIAECIYMDSGHCVCILKTFWLRIIQRTWKRVFAERRRITRIRQSPAALFYRQRTGVWQNGCRLLPSLQGMLQM